MMQVIQKNNTQNQSDKSTRFGCYTGAGIATSYSDYVVNPVIHHTPGSVAYENIRRWNKLARLLADEVSTSSTIILGVVELDPEFPDDFEEKNESSPGTHKKAIYPSVSEEEDGIEGGVLFFKKQQKVLFKKKVKIDLSKLPRHKPHINIDLSMLDEDDEL
jgi:hypothetical protein